MRASTFGCIIDCPCPRGSSRSAKASALCSGGTKSSRRTSCSRSSTAGSSTSQVRICCSIMLKRAWSKFMAVGDVRGSRAPEGTRERPNCSKGAPLEFDEISIECPLVTLERHGRNHEQDQGEGPDVLGDRGRVGALQHDGPH